MDHGSPRKRETLKVQSLEFMVQSKNVEEDYLRR
jgi:hypothetical protein